MKNKFAINPLVLAMAVVVPSLAYAQQEEAIEEVVVSGFRASTAKALDAKKESAGAVDAIMASDIAEFPDNNLAESLQRIPGVAISRSGGEGRNISIRGLGPNFTRVLINGMESISTTGGTDATGGNNRGRGFDFNTFSSDLFNSLTVRKTGAAEIDEGSLGATVDMRTANPFDYKEFTLTANAQLGYNSLSQKNDPSVGFLVANTFMDDKLGAILSYTYSERSILDQGTSTVRWSNASGERFGIVKGFNAGALGAGVAGAATTPNDFDIVNGPCIKATATASCSFPSRKFSPRIPRYDSYQTDLSRQGLSGGLVFKPTDSTEIALDALLSKYENTRQEKFMEASLNGSQNNTAHLVNYAIEGNTLVYGSLRGARLLAENRQDEMTTDFSQYTLSLKQDFTDSFRMKAMVGTSESDFQNPIQNTIIMMASNQDFTWDYRNGDARLTFGEGINNKANWSINSVRQRPQGTDNTYDTGSVQFEYDVTDWISLKAGASQKDFVMDTWQTAYLGGEALPSNATTNCALTGNTTAANTPSPTCGVNLNANGTYIVPFNSGIRGTTQWLLPNRAAIMDAYGLWGKPMTTNRGSTYQVEESTQAEYIQADFKTEVFGLPFRGDLGVRHFTTDQSSSQWVNLNGVWSQSQVTHSYSDTLPALNLVLEPIEDVQVRASYSEGIARAGLSSLVSETNVTVSGTSRSVSTGNPYLKPTGSKNYDVGIEWYFAPESMISFALFRKELSTQVQNLQSNPTLVEYFTSIGMTADDAITSAKTACGASYGTACNETMNWATTTPVNGPGGPLNGYEISYQQPFTFLPGEFQYFGFIGSYTHVDAKMDYVNSSNVVLSTASLVNLSPTTSSATIYYEKDAFHARVSVAHRGGYLTVATNDANLNYQNGTKGTTNVDAQVSYQVNDHFKVTLDMLNLTNELDDQWVDATDDRLSYVHETGRQFNLGVNYKF